MAELSVPSNPVFVDAASASESYPITGATEPAKPPSCFTQMMTEPSASSNTVFIDVASGSEQFPVTQVSEPMKEEQTNNTTSPLEEFLTIQPRRIRCPECQRYTAETEEKMLRHIRKIHRGENPFQCYMCDYSTYNKVLFEEHVRIHQGIKPYKCSHCPYRSVSKKNTKKHEQIHRPDNPHKCEQCGFIARHVRSLRHHEATHNKEARMECEMCKKKGLTSTSYKNHKKSRRRCPQCQKMFCKPILEKHCFDEHGINMKKKLPTKNVAKKFVFSCAICAWEGNSKPRILLHLIHHPNQIVDENIVDTLVLRELGIMVENCGTVG